MNFQSLPTPPELFRRYERGELSREQFHAAMALHAHELIDEMVEARKNPVAAYIEQLRNRAAASRLARRYGPDLVREVFATLGTLPDFPPVQLLWNASHREVPLHCFFRTKHEPIFRVLKMKPESHVVRLTIEYGEATATVRETITLVRDRFRRLELAERSRHA
ncbi:MAG: hypothetical protein KDN20_16435 [Verrucomicrobiae bacterium]|nr:hypothetical protein [Verrucomicrobiae bacterium]